MLKGSFKIARLFGIPVLLHWSFLLVAVWFAFYGFTAGMTLLELSWILLFSVLLFFCILMHELGHALTAKRFRVETKDIILLPIGGLARLNKLPEKPVQEMLVALAGPLTNVFIALLLLPYFIFITMPGLAAQEIPTPESIIGNYFFLLPLIIFLNILLAIFNLIPAFPMDGGRLFRALLSIKMKRVKATLIAVRTGQVIAVGMILYSIWQNQLSFALIGLFIFFAAGREYRWAITENLLSSHQVGEVFSRDFTPLYLDGSYQSAVHTAKEGARSGLLVFDDAEQLVGILATESIVEGAEADKVRDHYRKGMAKVQVFDTLKTANEVMQEHEQNILPVFEDDRLAGVLESDMIWDFLSGTDRKRKARTDEVGGG